jgi:hypothetical protein
MNPSGKLLGSQSAKKRLALIWFGGAAALFLFVVAFSLNSPAAGAVWAWFLPAVMPNLSLIVGVWVADARAGGVPDQPVDPFMYRLAAGLSAFYLLLIAALFLLHPYASQGIAGWLQASQLWLAAVQSLASLGMGAFYVQRTQAKPGS